MRKPIIAGNWKMNKTPKEAVELVKALAPLVEDSDATAVVCPPYVCLPAVLEAAKGTKVAVGAQNCHFEQSGAYTGEISPAFLKEMGVEYVVLGHSERREYFGETNETVNLRSKAAIANGLIPIICCGETLEQREAGVTEALVCYQVQAALSGMSGDQVAALVIAYEPIWAIGTGKTATSEDANQVIGWIRAQVTKTYGEAVGEAVRIQYGGSMKPANVSELMAQPEIDGGLVGGASLNADDFSAILNYNK